jgi:GNAT superfamily N-acetyltransferase
VGEITERTYFLLCLALGWLLRSARYSQARVVEQNGERQVRKSRRFYAPLLIWMSRPLVGILGAGVQVLHQREWEERERLIYQRLRGTSIRIDADGMLVLPCLRGKTLATVLEDPELEESMRKRAIELAVAALADFHRRGFSHGDAMAENVLVDLEADVAHWFDFETIHDPRCPMAWRRADDVRALLERHFEYARETTLPENVYALDIDALTDPAVTVFTYRVDGELLAVAALKRLDARHAEIKSMHTAEAARGRGIGR